MQLKETWRPYGLALAASLGVSLLSAALLPVMELSGIGMLFLLAVVLVAVRNGIGPAIFAAVVAGLLFDFLFVYPPLGFAFKDRLYLMTFAAMLVVGVFAGSLTAGLRSQADTARRREQRAQLLSSFAREMSAAVDVKQITSHAQRALGKLFDGRVVVMLPDDHGHLPATAQSPGDPDANIAMLAFRHDAAVGLGTVTSPSSPFHYIPLHAPGGICGVLAMKPHDPSTALQPDVLSELEAFARLVAIALERVHFVDVAQAMRLNATAENLRNSMLAALSHDLRTPLASLVGLADALALASPPLSAERQAMVTDIRDSALHMARLVNNILDMARIQSGGVNLRREWNSLEEIIGSALRLLRAQLADRRVVVDIPADFPLFECDALLIERVVANLVENAARHAGAGSAIFVLAQHTRDEIVLVVADSGDGLPSGVDPFAKFVRGDGDASDTGVGLGLAICRAFVDAHGGSISAANRAQGGAEFVVRLPAGTPPGDDGDGNESSSADRFGAGGVP